MAALLKARGSVVKAYEIHHFFRMLRNIFWATAITRRRLMLNRAVLARGSSIRNEKSEKPQQKEASSEEPSNSIETKFGL